jgi:AcrR family transcriptional regulator
VLRCHQLKGHLVEGEFVPLLTEYRVKGTRNLARRRSTRALINDAAIRDAAVELVLSEGIDAISFRDVGRIAGLTHGALYARFEDVEELLVDLWGEVLSHRAIALFKAASEASSNPSAQSVHALFDFVRDSSPADVAMVLVLLTSRRFVILHEDVESFIHDHLETTDVGTTEGQSSALLLFGLVMVQILQKSLFGSDVDDLEFVESIILASLALDATDVESLELKEPTDRIIPPPSNELRSQLAYHTFSAVGKSGYTRATISRISRRANCSPGAIYKLYPSKEDLVISATRKIMQAPWISITTLAEVLDKGVLAQLLYSAASEQNSVRKSFTLEIAIASAHSDKIRTAVQSQMQGLELLVPLIEGIDDDEKEELCHIIRAIISLSLGTSFLSTVTKATDQIDFNGFAEPIRRTLLGRDRLSWTDIRQQLLQLASTARGSVSRPSSQENPPR